jgi:hypothetical protein
VREDERQDPADEWKTVERPKKSWANRAGANTEQERQAVEQLQRPACDKSCNSDSTSGAAEVKGGIEELRNEESRTEHLILPRGISI